MGRVGCHGGPGRGAWRAGSARSAGWFGGASAGRVCGLGGLGRPGGQGRPGGAGRAGRSGPGRAVGAGLVGQDRTGPGCSGCERTHEWFLEICVATHVTDIWVACLWVWDQLRSVGSE